MKKLVSLIAGALLIAGNHTNAQTNQYVSLGPVAGFGHSWVSGVDNQVFKPSGYLGIGFIYSRYEHWGWGADLTASHEGFSVKENNTDVMMSVDPTYIRLAPKAYYFFGSYGSTVRPKVYLAPSLGVKVAEDHYYDHNRLNETETMSVFNDDEIFNTVDLGVTGGVGVNIKLAKSMWLNMDGSYYHGLLEATRAGDMNRNLRFNAGLMFGID